MCGLIVCGVTTCEKLVEIVPNGYTPSLKDVVCPYCSFKGDTKYKRKVHYFALFFTPLFPIKKDEPHISCISCRAVLGKRECYICKRCNTAIPVGFSYCVKCGNDLKTEKLYNTQLVE